MELKLTNVARASLEELRLDDVDFLRQRRLVVLPPDNPALKRFKEKRCSTVEEVRAWVAQERGTNKKNTKLDEEHGRTRTDTDNEDVPASVPSLSVHVRPCDLPSSSALVANAALSLLNLCRYLLDRQTAAQAKAFENEGGFTERLYRRRTSRRRSE